MLCSEINAILHAEWLGNRDNKEITEILIDTRKIMNPAKALFIALKGNRRDGHSFINKAYEYGVRCFLINQDIDISTFENATFLKVNDTLKSFQLFAKIHRQQFDYPVIGITGSNGKTVVKEWLYQLLSNIEPFNHHLGPIRSPKSFNSQIGVPLSIWLMKENHTIGIFEAGISEPNEMEILESIIQPNIGIFTNIGTPHNDNFIDENSKIVEKLKLFKNSEVLIYNNRYESIEAAIKNSDYKLKTFSWGTKAGADLHITSIAKDAQNTTLYAYYKGSTLSITIPFLDKAYLEDAIHCWCTLLYLNVDQDIIEKQIWGLNAIAMRLELEKGINDCTIINDTYSNDLSSLKIALEFLAMQPKSMKRTLILSDILQVSNDSKFLYTQVGQLIEEKNIYRLIGIGKEIKANAALFESIPQLECHFYETTEDFMENFRNHSFINENILLKGARIYRFEKIEQLLGYKKHKTVMEVNLSAIHHNLKIYKDLLAPNVKMMVMVKAYSYGSGSTEIANLLQYIGVDYLTVAYLDEGISLRKEGISLPIMVMSPEFGTYDQMIAWNIEPEIFSIQSLQNFIYIAKSLNINNYPIHIKLDTGMHRLGFMPSEMDQMIDIITKNKCVKVKSIFSHFVGSDSDDFNDFSDLQVAKFTQMSDKIIEALPYKILRHICNSSAISKYPQYQFDMVRLGIGLHGIDSNPSVQHQLQLTSTLKSTIAQIKYIPKEETIGYSRKGILERDSKIATVSIGYADGYLRIFGNKKAHMLVNGKPAKVIGNVCMDMCMLDITDIEDVKVGDEVEVFGSQLPVMQLAEWANTIPYEILTNVSQRVKRIYIND